MGDGMEGESEAYRDDSLRGAGLSAKERLARIEDILGTIVNKLDNKADLAAVAALELRIREIEVRGSKNAQDAIFEARRLADERVADLKEMREDVEKLEIEHDALSNKVSWAFGAVAALVLASDIILRVVIR